MRNWETFTMQNSKVRGNVPRVSLNVRGVFTLNKIAYDQLGQPEAVELLFDKATREVGFKPSKIDVKHSYSVRKQGKNNSYLIGARAFCNFYEIETNDTVVFDEVILEEEVLILDTNKKTNLLRKTAAGSALSQSKGW